MSAWGFAALIAVCLLNGALAQLVPSPWSSSWVWSAAWWCWCIGSGFGAAWAVVRLTGRAR